MTVIVVHSTETDTGSARAVTSYLLREGKASHEVFDPATGERFVPVRWPAPGKSLRNLPGGVQTNNRPGVWQVEVIGRAAAIPGYSDQWHRTLAAYLVERAREIGCPLEFPCEFMPYPSSYGNSSVRLSYGDWMRVEGIIGHQHVPENDHGDPGDISRTIAHIRALTAPTPEEDDMTARIIAAYIAGGRDRTKISWEEVCIWVDEIGKNNDPDGTLSYITWAVGQ